MKTVLCIILVGGLAAECSIRQTETGANGGFSDPPRAARESEVLPVGLLPSARTNFLAFYPLAEALPLNSVEYQRGLPPDMLPRVKLLPEPIFSDADFVAWNLTNHTFVITPAAAKRFLAPPQRASEERSLGAARHGGQGQFVLMARGEPIYLGTFLSLASSSSYAVPVILVDSMLTQCFIGWTNVPVEVLRMLGRGDSRATEWFMTTTNATTNVTLKISRSYPGFSFGDDEHFPKPDPRDDDRLTAAVERLFGNSRR